MCTRCEDAEERPGYLTPFTCLDSVWDCTRCGGDGTVLVQPVDASPESDDVLSCEACGWEVPA